MKPLINNRLNVPQDIVDKHYDKFSKDYPGFYVDNGGTTWTVHVDVAFQNAYRNGWIENANKIQSQTDQRKDKKGKTKGSKGDGFGFGKGSKALDAG